MSDSAIMFTRGTDILSFYPIGSIYLSVVNTNPATIFGGTWQAIQDAFLLGAGTTYLAGATGGEATHVLTENEMPTHTHTFTGTQKSTSSTTLTGSIRGTNNIGVNVSGAHIMADATGVLSNWVESSERVRFKGSGTITVGQWTHQRSVNLNAVHTHACPSAGTNANVGSGTAHNNMPPYLAVYAWERTG